MKNSVTVCENFCVFHFIYKVAYPGLSNHSEEVLIIRVKRQHFHGEPPPAIRSLNVKQIKAYEKWTSFLPSQGVYHRLPASRGEPTSSIQVDACRPLSPFRDQNIIFISLHHIKADLHAVRVHRDIFDSVHEAPAAGYIGCGGTL